MPTLTPACKRPFLQRSRAPALAPADVLRPSLAVIAHLSYGTAYGLRAGLE